MTYQELMIISICYFCNIPLCATSQRTGLQFCSLSVVTCTSSCKFMLFKIWVSLAFKVHTNFLWPASFPCLLEFDAAVNVNKHSILKPENWYIWLSWPDVGFWFVVYHHCLYSLILFSQWFRLLLLVYGILQPANCNMMAFLTWGLVLVCWLTSLSLSFLSPQWFRLLLLLYTYTILFLVGVSCLLSVKSPLPSQQFCVSVK